MLESETFYISIIVALKWVIYNEILLKKNYLKKSLQKYLKELNLTNKVFFFISYLFSLYCKKVFVKCQLSLKKMNIKNIKI